MTGMTRRAGILCLLIVAGAACRSGQPILSGSSKDPMTPGTIAGNVRDATGGPVAGRAIHAVSADTGRKYSATTNVTGGFSIPVPPGKYRLQVDLLAGESVTKDPGVIDINESDLDANLEVVISS